MLENANARMRLPAGISPAGAHPRVFFVYFSGIPAASVLLHAPHGQANAALFHVHAQHLHLDHIAHLHHVAGVPDELVGQLTHMHQAILMI